MDRGKNTGGRSGNRHGWAPSSSGGTQRGAYPPPVMPRPSSRSNSSGIDNNLGHCYSSSDNMNPYECIDEELQQQHKSGGRHHGSGFGGPVYHLGSSSREGLDILGPNIGYLEQSGSEGDGEEESPPVHHRKPGGAGGSGQLGGGNGHGGVQSHSLRRLNRSRFGGGGGVSQALLPNNGSGLENPYQQPYLSGRGVVGGGILGGGGLSDSPISNASDDVTLTDSELPFANQSNSTNLHSSALPPLQNGGLMMSGNLDYLGGGGLGNRGNSLKRTTLNSNGKSTTGVGLISHGHGVGGGNSSSNHESLMDQFIMQTPGGKIYIPQGDHTSKNSSSDYKGSPGSSPCKKSSSLLYKEGLHMGMSGLGGGGVGGPGDGRGGCMDATLRDLTLRSRATKLPTDDVDFLYKMRGRCTRNNVAILVLCICLVVSLLFNVLQGTGTLAPGIGCGNVISVSKSEYSHAAEQDNSSVQWRQSWEKGQGPGNNNRYAVSNPIPASAGGGGGRPFPATNFPPESSSFREITLGSRHQNTIGQYGYWNMQFYQPTNQYITLELSVPRGASIGFYARRNALPTHTHYDIVEIIRGFKTTGGNSGRQARSSPPSVTKEISQFLEEGHWFVSLYNDDSDSQQVVFGVSVSEEMTEGCPNGCSGNGQCQAGHCECNPGFGGEDCSRSVCPVLCSGRGDYVNGECSCNPGWKGKECNLHHDECEVSDCSGHGKCINGKCSCLRGYKGEFCQEVDCANPTCSGHGFCLAGNCMCKKGWRGADCSEPDNEALQCLPDCSSHGSFSLETQTCTCEPRWTGEDCSQELCDTNCGPNGVCIGSGCQCSDGWTGTLCNQRVCDKRCAEHGQCKNGTCLCVTGWNGKHCTLEGCPNSCSGHGQCKANQEGLWECKCHSGWNGPECSVMLEQNCNDAKDNDKDGLTDCEDPECCGQDICSKSQLCVSARRPIDILLRKQPPAITASFFEKMKFLIEEGSLQNYARQDAFNGSRSGVVRGRVVTPNGSGLMGVRVSSSSPLEPLGGFTLTQDDGSFDLMVNGGGAVTLQFGRSPFNAKTRTIFVPWNEVVIVDTIAMGVSDDKLLQHTQPCDAHDYELMKPVILATWKHGFQGDCPDASVILAESQVVQETLQIPGTGLNLMYHSSRTPGYSSTIELQLTSDVIPPTLKRIHLRITIEGVLFEKIFEGDPNVKYTYSWNRLNYYRQRVYGVTTAIVKVGYEYENCANTIWDVQSTTLSGHDMSISEIGGWNLDIHHRFNFHEGIIQKGDGTNIYLKYRPRVILTTMGNGYQRSLDCVTDCNGIAAKQKLLAPVALAAAADGTLFVGDFNLIRRVMVDGTVRNVVVRNATRVSYRYHIALSPVDNTLYISDPESHQIVRVKNAEQAQNPEYNWEVVVGSGERCLPGDEAHCGDEALARDAKLTYPKGVAISADNILYFADGTNIRKVDRDGIITTVIGNHQQKSHWKPIPCEGTLKVEEVHLRWPTDLAINPLDNSLYIIDDHMILKLTDDNRIRIIAGRPIQCLTPLGGFENDLATHTTLISPQSMTFAPNGDLYVAESDSQRISRVRLITTDGRIGHFAGAESKCNCLDRDCSCFDEDHYLAATTKFNTISSIIMAPNGILHIADQGNHRIRSVQALIPSSTQPSESKQYEVYFPETQEIYIFNRFGQHIATKNIITGETIYTFLYNVNMSNGKLISVTDSIGNKIQILRDISLQVKSIENSYGQKFNVKISRKGMLQEWSTPEGYNVTFNYHGSLGLLKSRQDSSGRSSIYFYDEFGRLIMAISPTGQIITLNFDLNSKGATVKITKDQDHPTTLLIKGSTLFKRVGKLEHVTSIQPDGSVIRLYPWSQVATTESVPYNVLGELNPVLSDSFPITGKQKVEIANELMNRIEWRYIARKEGKGKHKQVVQIDKKLRVNGENILMVEYDRESKSELIFIDDRNEILNVSYDRIGRPLKWTPSHGFAAVELDYDRYGRLIEWKWADLTETYEYDRSGRLFKIRYSDGTSLTHTFKDSLTTLPSKMTTGGQSDYLLEYDDSGSFQSLTTPRGHIHTFGVSTSVGVYEYQYKSPSSRDMYKIQYNDAGHILSIIYPSNSGRINYIYNKHGRLEVTLGGLHSATYVYQEVSGLVKVVDIIQANFEVKIEFKYHGGLVKEQRYKFGSRTGLDNTHIKYQFDGNGRITTIEVEVNGRPIQVLAMKKNQNTGVLESVHDLAVLKTANMFNRTIIQDTTSKSYFHTVERDEIGRPATKLVHLNGKEVYRLQIDYNSHGRVKHRKLIIGRGVYTDSVAYDADGHVTSVVGSGSWKYNYDENGNIVQIMEQEEKSSLIYDTGDRVVQVGELIRYTYDSRGFLIQRGNEKFQYDDNGLLIHAIKKDGYKVWFFYDHLSRLISTQDAHGNVTQFLYTNLEATSQHMVTHIHYPATNRSILCLYDENEHLIALVTQSGAGERYYVATDQNGSPIALFNIHGLIVKEVHRSPFGKTVRDTSTHFNLPIDYFGGILDRHSGLLIITGRPYDSTIGQWMTPSWAQLPTTLNVPTDIFTYRFHQNDPISPATTAARFSAKMTTLAEWAKLFGYSVPHIFGLNYLKPLNLEPTINSPLLNPEFNTVSGLDCIADTIGNEFKTFGFYRESKLNPERLMFTNNNAMSTTAGVSQRKSSLLVNNKFAYRPTTLFGSGLLVSRMSNGRALISTVDNSVVQGVLTSLLNGSLFIDLKSTHSNTFFFIKDNPLKLRDDLEELKRLGGLYNISIHEVENGVKELRLSNGDSSIAVRYGTELEEEYQRLVKHAHRRAIERAWEDEKFALSLGLDGRRLWTDEEREQLLSKGSVHGYRPSDLYSVHKYPQLADDPNNVAFLKDSRRKRRKSHSSSKSDNSFSNHEHEHSYHHTHHNHENFEDSSLHLFDSSSS